MDTTCKPCTDFWRYVNGGWLDKNPIPADKSSYGTFTVLADANRERIRTILDAAAANGSATPGSDQRKMGDLYASCMDTAAIDARELTPLQADFDRISAVKSAGDLGAVLAAFQRVPKPIYAATNGAVVGPFRMLSGQDSRNPSRVIARIVERESPGGSGSSIFSLPDPDYYFRDDEKSRQIRGAFLDHVAKMLEFSGTPRSDAEGKAKTILDFETELAASVMTIADRRDPDKTYHLTDLTGLRAMAPNFDWAQLFRTMALPDSTPVNVAEPELLKTFDEELTVAPLDTWKTWLRWRTLQLAAPYLPKAIEDEAFHFQGTILAGTPQAPPRWETCANQVDRDLGDALGSAYVNKYRSEAPDDRAC